MNSTLLVALLAVLVVEIVLSGTFAKPYFTIGLPLFMCEVNSGGRSAPLPSPEQIAAALPKTIFHRFVFSQLEPSRFAFRERAWGSFFRFSYTPVMHGSLLFDRNAGRVRMVALANWFPLAFVALFAATIPSDEAFPFTVFLGALLLFIYAIQVKRYREVANIAAQCWGNEKSPANAG
jgi:hypothetical protein